MRQSCQTLCRPLGFRPPGVQSPPAVSPAFAPVLVSFDALSPPVADADLSPFEPLPDGLRDEYPSAYQPPPFRRKLLDDTSLRTRRPQLGHFLSGLDEIGWMCSKAPQSGHSYS